MMLEFGKSAGRLFAFRKKSLGSGAAVKFRRMCQEAISNVARSTTYLRSIYRGHHSCTSNG